MRFLIEELTQTPDGKYSVWLVSRRSSWYVAGVPALYARMNLSRRFWLSLPEANAVREVAQ